jgi:hypothetical protein
VALGRPDDKSHAHICHPSEMPANINEIAEIVISIVEPPLGAEYQVSLSAPARVFFDE